MTTLLDGCARAGRMEQAEAVLQGMERRGLRPNVVSYNVVLRGYAAAGDTQVRAFLAAEALPEHAAAAVWRAAGMQQSQADALLICLLHCDAGGLLAASRCPHRACRPCPPQRLSHSSCL